MFISFSYYCFKIYDFHSHHIVARKHLIEDILLFYFLVFLRTPFELC